MRTLLSRLRSALGRDIVSGRDELGLSGNTGFRRMNR